MIINKTSQKISVRYNGITKDIQPGEGVDVRDFDIPNQNVKGVEKHICGKYPGSFDVKDTKEGRGASKEYEAQIIDLQAKLDSANKTCAELRKNSDSYQEKFAAGVEEVQAAKKETASIKKDLVKLQKENEDLKDEVEKLRLASRSLKKG